MAWNPTTFREVPGFPGYFVSSAGDLRGPSGKVLKHIVSRSGYHFVCVSRVRSFPCVTLFVHKAVLLAFVGPKPDGMECRHLDGNQSNNSVENLAWGTRQENVEDRVSLGTQHKGETAPTAKLSELQVIEIRKRYGTTTIRALGREFGVSHTQIRRAALGIKWKHIPKGEPKWLSTPRKK